MKEEKHLPAKACYTHIGGKLGMLLMEAFIDKAWIAQSETESKHFYITPKGAKEFGRMGIDLSQIKPE